MDQTYAAIDQLVRLIFLDVMHAAIEAAFLTAAYLLVRKFTRS